MLKLMCNSDRSTTVAARVAGTTRMAIRVIFRLRRNSQSTIAASTTPIRMESRTLAAESSTSSLWSYQLASLMPAGSLLL